MEPFAQTRANFSEAAFLRWRPLVCLLFSGPFAGISINGVGIPTSGINTRVSRYPATPCTRVSPYEECYKLRLRFQLLVCTILELYESGKLESFPERANLRTAKSHPTVVAGYRKLAAVFPKGQFPGSNTVFGIGA
eukprot:2419945-Rhodomonas_salina.1